jgi:ubiquinone/menaquinone biosynthesis C-methylase UbiE
MNNIDIKVVESFGDEWSQLDQSKMNQVEAKQIFKKYFFLFPWSKLHKGCEGFDMGCGSGRWANFVASRVGQLHCIDPSSAIEIAKKKLKKHKNIKFYKSSVDNISLKKCSQDFGYSLGVLHHIPDTQAAIKSCVKLLKPGAPLLLYIYYSFDNRPKWFRSIWFFSNIFRKIISLLPAKIKLLITNIIALLIYYPLAKFSFVLIKFKINVSNIPLSFYSNYSFYTMRTDARDRFGTPLEKRFSKNEIKKMMQCSGLKNIKFSNTAPFWVVIGYKKK